MRESFLPYCQPHLDADDVNNITESLKHGWLTTGPKVRELEELAVTKSGVKNAICLNSCTAALHLALVALGVKPGDEVVMPALTFVAGAQCARHIGAIPVFADVDPATLCITVETVRQVVTSKTKVIIPMQYGGAPCDMQAMSTYANARGIRVLEDAAHAAGTLDQTGKWAGSYSSAAAYSFYATKNVTSAEGGMLLTNDDALADRVRVLALHGMDKDAWKRYTQSGKWRYDVIETGYKYNMPDLAASLGIAQFRKLERLQMRRDQLAAYYLRELEGLPGIRPAAQIPNPPARHSWCVFAVLVDEEKAGISRDQLIEELTAQNIGTSVHFIPTHLFSAFSCFLYVTATTEKLWRQLISLPLYPSMSDNDARDVVLALQEIVGKKSADVRVAAG